MITVLSIGTGEFGKLTMEGYELLKNAEKVVLQTEKIPIAEELKKRGISFSSLDSLYDEAEDFSSLAEDVNDYLKEIPEDVLFCVLGSIYTNELVRELSNTNCEYVAGVGFAEEALNLIGPPLYKNSFMMTTASNLDEFSYDGQSNLLITEVDSMGAAYEAVDYLLKYFPGDRFATYINKGRKKVYTLRQLYRVDEWDYSTSIYVPGEGLKNSERYTCGNLLEIMDRLLGPEGCQWDKAQTHESLRQYLLEETYEAIDAINKEDPYMLCDELGDILYQIVFHAKIAEKHSDFDFTDVTTAISKKMLRRHPHVFEEFYLIEDWEEIKKKEKKQKTNGESLEDIPAEMGALMKYDKVLRKLDSFGTPSRSPGILVEEIRKKLADAPENLDEKYLMELLADVAELSHSTGINPEIALERKISEIVHNYT